MENLPYITTSEGTAGKIRQKPEHFIVEEIPAYPPIGTGSHLFVNITKQNQTTKQVQEDIAKQLNMNPLDISFAGMKDKHAITTQWFSINLDTTKVTKAEAINKIDLMKNIKLNSYELHDKKLKPGHLKANKFTIIISETDKIEQAKETAKQIEKTGIPNYYGEQRFGVDNDNAEKGKQIIQDKLKIREKFQKKLYLNSYQSYLCNLYLTERLNQNLINKILKGDIAKKTDTGGMFIVEDPITDQKRMDKKEITFTAPMFGYKMTQPTHESLEFENKILEKENITIQNLKKAKLKGTRRQGIIFPENLEIKKHPKGIQVSFTLRKGSFATIVLREFMKND
ncbi:MAG: tRNA pseudouridine(13) synthase TruD [Nanoarchaeota archaeon]|nr:tRNA pseudouridine(13) synthase TruD [Nanoarchaeota archaeon]